MSQSRTQSLIEAFANIAIGMIVAFSAQLVIFPALGMVVRLDQNVAITVAFTVVSLVRSYALRRFFNWLHERQELRGRAEAIRYLSRVKSGEKNVSPSPEAQRILFRELCKPASQHPMWREWKPLPRKPH